MAHERKCIVDLKEYKYCNKCGGYNADETWRFIFCSENCRGIYGVVEKFVSGKITELEAQELLKKFDLSELEHFHPTIKKDVDRIYAVKPAVIEPKVEIETLEDIPAGDIVFTAEDTEKLIKPKRNRKKTTTEIDE